jgi:hypothetical protein
MTDMGAGMFDMSSGTHAHTWPPIGARENLTLSIQ